MNLLPTYEQLIAEKLGIIEIPDMADAIWTRIEAALDVEMPVRETPAASDKPFYNDPAVWTISAGVIAIIIALFLLFRSWNTAPPPERELPQQTEPAKQPDTILNQDQKPPDRQKPAPKKNERKINEKHAVDTTARNLHINVETDSLLKKPPAIIAPPTIKPPAGLNPAIDVKQRPKYGVQVSDSDYRFDIKTKQQ